MSAECKHGCYFPDGDECCGLCAGEEIAALKARIAELTEPRFFPIQDGPAIPWAVIAPHERQAQRNHSQTLEVLAARGGLAPCEAVAVLEDRRWRSMPANEALALLKELAGWMPPEEAKAVVANCLAAVKLRNEAMHREEQLRARLAEAEAQIAQLKALVEMQHAATNDILNGLGDVVPLKRGLSRDDFATLRRALHHTAHCQDALPARQCNCGCREALDLLNQKENS